jgi:hypothetical protein
MDNKNSVSLSIVNCSLSIFEMSPRCAFSAAHHALTDVAIVFRRLRACLITDFGFSNCKAGDSKPFPDFF